MEQLSFKNKEFPYLPELGAFVISPVDHAAIANAPCVELQPARPSGSALFFELTKRCNLSCPFCYVQRSNGTFDLSFDAIRKAVDLETQERRSNENISVTFLGGEPTLCWDQIERTIRYCGDLTTRLGTRFEFLLVTNGNLLDSHKVGFCKDHGIDIQLSIEGTPGINGVLRAGQEVEKATELLHANGLEPWLKFTISPQSLAFSESLRYCVETLRCFRIGIAICAHKSDDFRMNRGHVKVLKREIEKSVSWLEQERLIDAVDFYYFPGKGSFFLRQGLAYPRWSKTAYCPVFLRSAAVDATHRYYPCPLLIGREELCLGDVHTGKNLGRSMYLRRRLTRTRHEHCRDCWLVDLCGGECCAHSAIVNDDPFSKYDAHCEFVKLKIAFGLYKVSTDV